MSAASGHLWRDVVGRPAHGEVLFVWEFELSGQAKVCDLNVHVGGQQKVGQGQISMQDAMGVEVQHPFYYLMHELSRCGGKT